jgi:V-type H+-transporting ATPase subunit a
MSFFRSEKMGYYNIVLSRENAWEILNDFGEIDALHFIDQDPLTGNFARPFANYVKRCDEISLKLSFVETEMKKFGRTIIKCDDYVKYLKSLKEYLTNRERAQHTYLEDVETEVEKRSEQLQEQLKNYEEINQKKNHLLEYRAVLKKTKQIIGDSQFFE